MPPRRGAETSKHDKKKKSNSSSSSGGDEKVQKKRKQQTKNTSSKKKRTSNSSASNTSSLLVVDSQQVDHEFYFNLWGQEVNEDLMQYILDYVPVYPNLLNMRAVNRFWKNKLETVFFPKVKVLDLMTREKYEIEKFKSANLKRMASYFPNFTTLRVCQSGWEGFFEQPNKIETFEFYDLECVAVATGFLDLLVVLVDCHKNNKHPSYLKTVNIYGTSETYIHNGGYNAISYLNGTHKKSGSHMSYLETINLFYHDVPSSILTKLTKVKADKPITEYDNVLEFWDRLVYEENINWNLLHPFKLAELKNDDLYDVIIEYAKAQEIPVKLSDYESQLASSDLMFDEFYKKFIANSELDPCLRYKIDKDMLDRIFEKGNDHLLNQVIENKEIPLIIEGAYNPLISLAQNGKISLLKKALEREPSLLTLGTRFGKIESDIADMNLLYLLVKGNRYRNNLFPIAKNLIEIGVDINYTGNDGSILNLAKSSDVVLLPLFENIKLETLEKKNSNGLSTIEVWSSKYDYYGGPEVLKFFNDVFQRNGQDLKNFRTSSGGNLLHTLSLAPITVIEYAIGTLGIDICHSDNDGIPAFFNVNQKAWTEKLLASVKKDLDIKDANGNTYLCNTITNSNSSLSCLLVKQGCDLEYALSNIGSIKSKFFDLKKGEPFVNGAKLLLQYAFERSTNYFNILKGNLEILKKCFEIEITMSSEQFGEIRLTPVHTYLMFGIEFQTIADLGLITRKRYIVCGKFNGYGSYLDEKEGVINGQALGAMVGVDNYNYGDKTEFEKESSITKLNSWQLAVKYGHHQQALRIISHIGKSVEECQHSITEIAALNLQYHILEESLKQKLKEKKLEENDKKLISGYIFNFLPFSDFSDLEPFIEDLIDSDILEQKCIVENVARETNRELKDFLDHYRLLSENPSTIRFIGKMYNNIEEPITYHLSMLEVCALKGYPLKKIQEKLSTEKELVQFLSRKEKSSGKTIMHLLCDSSLSIYLNADKRDLLSYKHSMVISFLSKLSAASKKQVLNLLDSDHETPIFAAIRSDFKNLVKSLAPNTDMSVRNLKGKDCLDIATSEMNDILMQYADKKTLAAKREIEEEQKSRKKKK